jgi:formylglycine-generating enzyme required for sulfatase activity
MRSLILAVVFISAIMNSARADDWSTQSSKDAPSPLTAPFDAAQAKAAQEAWAKHFGKSSPMEKSSIGVELMLIPPGKFTMGSPRSEKDRSRDEDQVDVTLTKPFYLGKTEVTQMQWVRVMGTTPWLEDDDAREGDNYPATGVSWNDAQAFCKRLSEKENRAYRLPTEAEWEYACRGGTTTRFSFGDDETKLAEYAWYFENAWDIGERFAHEVGLKKNPNPFGLHDMHGNVYEWCQDVYVDKLPGGTDPVVAIGGARRVRRGGEWGSLAAFCRSAFRSGFRPTYRDYDLGFRVARSSEK